LTIERRKNFIVNKLKEKGEVEVHNLSEKLDVSEMTIRRDLKKLEEEGVLIRNHGGAVYPVVLNEEISYQSKQTKNREEKNRIGREALKYIKDGKVLFIDAGTTCFELAKKLNTFKNLTVVTNDIRIANELYTKSNIELYCTGGFVQSQVGAMLGEHTKKIIESLNIDIAFVGTSSIDNELFLSTPTREKAVLKQKIIKSGNKSILLSDHSKFGKKSLHKICKIDQFNTFITDKKIQKTNFEEVNDTDVELVVV
jgi:DeoR/GlpR family transcriptional regulator of sugar metabolism